MALFPPLMAAIILALLPDIREQQIAEVRHLQFLDGFAGRAPADSHVAMSEPADLVPLPLTPWTKIVASAAIVIAAGSCDPFPDVKLHQWRINGEHHASRIGRVSVKK